MKFNKYISIFLAVIILALSACQKNIDVFIADPGQVNGPDTNWAILINDSSQISLLKNNLLLETIPDSTDIGNSSSSIVYPSGLKCIFPANSLVFASANPAHGKVNIDVLLLKTKGDMIRMNKPTIADGKLLVSGGALFIGLRKENNILYVAGSSGISISYSAAAPLSGCKLFWGEQNSVEKFNWKSGTGSLTGYVSTTNLGYEIKSSQAGWLSAAKIYESTSPETVVVADLPAYFTNANTAVYLVFKNMLSVIGMYGKVTDKKFSSSPVPAGSEVTVVVISKQGNDFFLGHKDLTTALPSAGSVSQRVAVTPVKVSLESIRLYLESL